MSKPNEQEFTFVLEQHGREERCTAQLPRDQLLSFVPNTAVSRCWPDFDPWAPARLRLLRQDGTDHFVWELQPSWTLVER